MTRVQWILVGVLSVVFAFAIGFGWQYARATAAETELRQTSRELTFKRIEATLSAAAIHAQQASYEPARALASDFFSGLQRAIGDAPPASRAEMEAILAQRDDVITLISRVQPEAGALLAELALRFRAMLL